jgi:hypothetical protein
MAIPLIDHSLCVRASSANAPLFRTSPSLTLEGLLRSSQALREKIVVTSMQNKDRLASNEAREAFVKMCAQSGVLIEYAQILCTLPPDEMLDLQRRIVAFRKSNDDALQALIAAKISEMFLQARSTLIAQLRDTSFRAWMRQNNDYLARYGGPARYSDSSNTQWFPRSQAYHSPPEVKPSYPLSSVFAFFNATAGTDLAAIHDNFDQASIIQQLINLANSEQAAIGKVATPDEGVDHDAGAESAGERNTRILKKFRCRVYRAITLYNNPSVIQHVAHHRQTQSLEQSKVLSAAYVDKAIQVLSVQEHMPKTPMVKRQSSRYVVVAPPRHEEKIANAEKQVHKSGFVPTIVFISCALTLLVVVRQFTINMCLLSHTIDWVVGIAHWLNQMCDRVEMFGRTGLSLFECFTPGKLEALMKSEAGAELQKSVQVYTL